MLPQLLLNKDLSSCEPILLSIPRKLSKRRVEPDVDCQPFPCHDSTGGKLDMSTLRQFRNLWLPWVTAIILAYSGNAVAQTNYKVTDQGTLDNDNMSCAMTLNNRGWTAIQDGNALPGQQDMITTLLNGRDAIVINGVQVDLGTLGGKNSFMNWGEINDRGQIVGYSETEALDPNGEDICGFVTGHICLPFVWQDFHLKALPTLGGNNGQASSINSRGLISGTAETAATDPGCPPHLISLPVLWDEGKPRALPTVDHDTDGDAFWVNDLGHAVGQTESCNQITHPVSWTNGTVSALPDYGHGGVAFGNNDLDQIVGAVGALTARPGPRFGRTANSSPSSLFWEIMPP
jgi:uncharacterized membrane protein